MSRIPRNAAGIGCRGGTGPNAGKKSATYEYTLPNGETDRVRSFTVKGEEAVAHCFQGRDQRWYAYVRSKGAPAPYQSEGDPPYVQAVARRVEGPSKNKSHPPTNS